MRRAFTLIELLVVIAIIAVLAAILFPVFARARERAQRTACQSNLHQIGLAIRSYQDDWDDGLMPSLPNNGGFFRTSYSWAAPLSRYVKSDEIFICPSNPYHVFSYGYNKQLANKASGDASVLYFDGFDPDKRPTETILVFDAPNADPKQSGFLGEWDVFGEAALTASDKKLFLDGDLEEQDALADALKTRPRDTPLPDWVLPRHGGGNDILFLDGHVQWLRKITDRMGLRES